ncbi:MAG: hypothetical protein JNK48_14220 [Bryobacterales bacterium]|nr:hypothetical protein [Bryobacterales bacterium]
MTPVGAAVTPCPLEKKPVHWIEIELVGEDSQPVPWEEYQVVLPDGTEAGGYLDENGFVRIDGIETAGMCRIWFPRLDRDAWEEAAAREG